MKEPPKRKESQAGLEKKGFWKNPLMLMFYQAALEFAVLIGVPLGIFVIIYKRLNNGRHSKLFVITGILAALLISIIAISGRIKDYKRRLKQ